MPKSEKAKESARRRQREYYHRKKQKQALMDILPTNPSNILDNLAHQVQNKVANQVTSKLATSVSNTFLKPENVGLADATGTTIAKTLGVAALGAIGGYTLGNIAYDVIYAGLKGNEENHAKFRIWGALGGLALAGGGYWYYKTRVAQQKPLANNLPIQLQAPLTLADMKNMSFERIMFNREFEEFFGDKANKHDLLVVHGKAGSAKSHFTVKLLASLQQQGKTLLISTEESISDRIKERLAKYGGNGILFIRATSIEEILAQVQATQPRFLAVDSLSNLGLSNDEEKKLSKTLKTMVDLLVIVLHATKDGTYKGSSSILHEADLEVIMEDGVATVGKTRLHKHGIMNLFPKYETGNVFSISPSKTAQM